MLQAVISIPEMASAVWLTAVADMKRVRDVCLPANALLDPETPALCARLGLEIAVARELATRDIAPYLDEMPAPACEGLVTAILDALQRCREHGVRAAFLGCGLERISGERSEIALATRVDFLRKLMSRDDSSTLRLCLPVRYPQPSPGDREREWAGRIVHEVMHPDCRLALTVFPSELPTDFAVREAIRPVAFQLGLVQFSYEPMLGETIRPEVLRQWLTALRWHGYRGLVVFRPVLTDESWVEPVCERLDRLIEAVDDGSAAT